MTVSLEINFEKICQKDTLMMIKFAKLTSSSQISCAHTKT